MRTDAYTAEAICKCMGIPSFEADPVCTDVVEAIRLLLKPSFHPEVCLTFVDSKVSVVCARSMIWRQIEPSPMLTDRAEGAIPAEFFTELISALLPVLHTGAVPDIIIDGMPSELLHFQHGRVSLRAGGNAGRKGEFSAFVTLAIATAWKCISSPYCRNTLSEAEEYVGSSLPRDDAPPRKPTVKTMVLGPKEDREQLIEALRKAVTPNPSNETEKEMTPQLLFKEILASAGDWTIAVRAVREKFGLDLAQAKEVMLQAIDPSTTLDGHEQTFADNALDELGGAD